MSCEQQIEQELLHCKGSWRTFTVSLGKLVADIRF